MEQGPVWQLQETHSLPRLVGWSPGETVSWAVRHVSTNGTARIVWNLFFDHKKAKLEINNKKVFLEVLSYVGVRPWVLKAWVGEKNYKRSFKTF